MEAEYLIRDFLKRIKRPLPLIDNQDYKLVTIKMKHKGVILRGTKKGCEIKSNMYEVKAGDFILSGIDARNGAFGIVSKELDGSIVTNDFWYFEIDETIISKRLFLELTATTWFDEICKRGSDGTTQRIRLQKDKFFNQKVSLPVRAEQDNLLNKLLSLKVKKTELYSEIKNQQELLRILKQSILQEAIQGKLTEDWRKQNLNIEPASELLKRIKTEKEKLISEKKIRKEKPLPPITDEEIPFELPKGWVWCMFVDTAFIVRGGSPRPIGNYLTTDKDGINWIKIGDTKNDNKYIYSTQQKIKKDGLKKSRYVEPGDFLLTNSMSFGKPYIMRTTGCIHDGWLLIKTPREIIDEDYLYYMLSSNYTYKSFKESARGGVVQNLNIDKVKETIIPIPPLAEQEVIVEKVKTLMQKVSAMEEDIQQSEQNTKMLMQAVLKEAFTNNKNLEVTKC